MLYDSGIKLELYKLYNQKKTFLIINSDKGARKITVPVLILIFTIMIDSIQLVN